MPEIGETLRDARMRARIDVSEIEAKTKIRAKYLRALENEEWGLLPGPTFVKSFLRTYAQALGLDGKALVEEYRLSHEHPSEAALEPIVSSPQRNRGRPSAGRPPAGPSRGYMVAVGAIVVVIVLLIVALISNGGGSKSNSASSASKTTPKTATKKTKRHTATSGASSVVALSLHASAPVYVCLIGDHGRRAINGKELQAGETTSTYHAKRFEITLGNSSVTMIVDGHARSVPASSKAIGYSIVRGVGRTRLHSGQLPTCT
ncbi:MAG: helix-turn-helix domain-containing protein [Solirubrobacteraceae bacterium]